MNNREGIILRTKIIEVEHCSHLPHSFSRPQEDLENLLKLNVDAITRALCHKEQQMTQKSKKNLQQSP